MATAPVPNPNELLTAEVAAKILGVRPQTLAVWRTSKRYPLAYVAGRFLSPRSSAIKSRNQAATVGGSCSRARASTWRASARVTRTRKETDNLAASATRLSGGASMSKGYPARCAPTRFPGPALVPSAGPALACTPMALTPDQLEALVLAPQSATVDGNSASRGPAVDLIALANYAAAQRAIAAGRPSYRMFKTIPPGTAGLASPWSPRYC